MKDAYYFSHDSNARHDPKIIAMRNQYGAKGYGWYWIIVEMLREQDDYKIEIKDYLWNALAMELQCEPNKAEDFVNDCIDKFELFNSDDDKFWSESLLRRMEIKDKKKKKKAEAGRKGAKARWSNDNDKQKDGTANGGANGTAKANESDTNGKNGKGKESKVKEKKEKEIKEIWDFYCELFEGIYNPRKFSDKRKGKIKQRLNTYSMSELKTALKNMRNNDFLCGDNDKNKVYAKPEYCFRNDEKVEEWLNVKQQEEKSEEQKIKELMS